MKDSMKQPRSPYQVLGIDPGASPAEIRRAYLTLARRHHPDAGGDAEDMRVLNDAWAQLSARDVRAPLVVDREGVVDDGFSDESGPSYDHDWSAPAEDWVAPAGSRTMSRTVDTLSLLALMVATASAALSFLFGLIFESGPLLGFCVFSLFMAGVLVLARVLLAMGYDRRRGR
jgi:hypothetical protein